MTTDELVSELASVVSQGNARALLARARRVAGLRNDQALEMRELLMVLECLGSEGGALQEMAETLAVRALGMSPLRDARDAGRDEVHEARDGHRDA